MPDKKPHVCAVVPLLVIAGGFVRFGSRYWRAYSTVKAHVEAEQDFAERVKREAGR